MSGAVRRPGDSGRGGAQVMRVASKGLFLTLAILELACGGGGSSTGGVIDPGDGSYLLAVSKSGSGSGTVTSVPAGISCGADCSQSYTRGTSVTLTAAPASGSSFASWTGCASTSGAACTVAMTAARTVTAKFDPTQTQLTASFTSDSFTPGTKQITMTQATASGDTVTVSVQVRNTSGLYGAGFNIAYDASHVGYVSWTAGTLLETGGNQVSYIVSDKSSLGVVVMNVTRVGSEPAIDVTNATTLINVTFRVRAQGSFPLTFEDDSQSHPTLYDAQIPSQPISGITWYGGSLQGS
jgi:hypothetical protein